MKLQDCKNYSASSEIQRPQRWLAVRNYSFSLKNINLRMAKDEMDSFEKRPLKKSLKAPGPLKRRGALPLKKDL